METVATKAGGGWRPSVTRALGRPEALGPTAAEPEAAVGREP